MPLYIVIAHDGTDDNAMERRLAVREAHLAVARRMKAQGEIVEAGAILDEQRRMIGSMLLVSFDTREQLDAWLKADPYVTGNVWQRIEVNLFQPAPL